MALVSDSTPDAFDGSPAARLRASAQRNAQQLSTKRKSLLLFVAAALLTAPMVLPLLFYPIGFSLHLHAVIELLLATPVQFAIGSILYRKAWKALASLSGSMELLVMLGSTTAYGISAYWVLRHGVAATGHVYFEQSSAAITLVVLGYWLETRTVSMSATSASRQLVDRLSGLFMAAAIAVSIATCLGWLAGGSDLWQALKVAISVLIVASPCAIGLAAPLALAAAESAASRAGILVKDIAAFERAARVDTVVFDKAGTLTEGQLAVVAMELAPGVDERRVLRFAAAAQAMGDDPVARAIFAAVPSGVKMPRIGSARIDPGCGVTAMIEGHEVALGNRAMLRRAGIDLGRVEAALLRFEREGKVAVVVAADARVLGVLAIADPVRRHAAAAISMLAAQNMRTDLVTADQHPAASRVAVELGVTGFRATMQPADVLAVIRALEVQGRRVVLVGACGNDNSALAAATVALAFGKGTDPDAVAGVMLTRADPRLVPATIDIARHAIVAVRRNLFLALLYNAAAIPLAALGLLTPAVAVAAMALSILSVAVISLWLKRWKPQFERG